MDTNEEISERDAKIIWGVVTIGCLIIACLVIIGLWGWPGG